MRLFALVIAMIAWAWASACAQTPADRSPAGSDWPGFLGPTADSKTSERGILTRWPKEGPPLVWQLELGSGYCMPAIADGRLYQFDRVEGSARLRALDPRTAKLLWTFAYPSEFQDLYGYDNGPRSSPVVSDGRVYIFGAEGMLHCLDAATGKLFWKIDTAAEFGVIQNFFGVGSTPVVEGDLLIVQIGGSPPESKRIPPGRLNLVEGNGSGIVAFDKITGAVRYKITDELASYATPKLATIAGRRWCFVLARGGLVGFEPATGKVEFQFPWRAGVLESVNASDPVVKNDLVFIAETYGPGSALLRVRPGNADVVWSDAEKRRDKSMQTHWNTAIEIDGYLYASSGRHTENAELRCVELATGNVMWSEPGLTRASLLYVDGHFVCLSEDGALRLLKANAQKYEPVAEVILRGAAGAAGNDAFDFGPPRLLKYPAWAAPILSHGLLYVRGADRLVCLELIPGNKPPESSQ
ncbi:MAG: PQQ-binding-like beta-propeller repeat protein [Pirellulales bacterium]